MPATVGDGLTIFPPFEFAECASPVDKHDSPLDGFDPDSFGDMAGNASPFIKAEPNNDFFDPNQFMQFNQQNNQATSNININPANMSNGMGQNFMSSSFHMGNSGIADDELLDLDLNSNGQQGGHDFNQGMSNFLGHQPQYSNSANMFSNTPDGAPIQSPFISEMNFGHFRPMAGQQFAGSHSVQSGLRSQIPQSRMQDPRSPVNPNSPAMNNLQNNEEFPNHAAMQIRHRHHNSTGWESTPSGHSWEAGSSFSSPTNGHPVHPQISEVLKATPHHKVASSLPTKIEPGTQPGFTSQEAKKRRRRESHNMVERRRRDNINERIHDMGTLVPQHRLEDEKVRKHLQTNAPLSPSIANATSMSPPNTAATPAARRAGAGGITQGLPIEEKDKGPNKGDILNGSVAWAKDIMWYLHLKLRQEQELQELVSTLGGAWPFEVGEDEKRMRSEICEILNKHAPIGGFPTYSRSDGSGLRVPGYTNIAGDAINSDGQSNGHSISPMSPTLQPGGSAIGNGGDNGQYWSRGDFKEEDEYDMDLQQ